MRLDVRADPGDSGGPVVDATGRLVGIVYATERVTQLALVIPVSVLRLVLAGALAPRGC
jgi:S1-C subfamily serine protease